VLPPIASSIVDVSCCLVEGFEEWAQGWEAGSNDSDVLILSAMALETWKRRLLTSSRMFHLAKPTPYHVGSWVRSNLIFRALITEKVAVLRFIVSNALLGQARSACCLHSTKTQNTVDGKFGPRFHVDVLIGC
jgi:hypothetical protein